MASWPVRAHVCNAGDAGCFVNSLTFFSLLYISNALNALYLNKMLTKQQ